MTTKISILAIDLAKGSFQVCAVGPDGAVVFNRAVSRTWTCHAFVPLRLLTYAAFASKAKGLFQPRAECLRRGL